MPVYVYEVVREDGGPGERFEVVQSMKDEELTAHPETGEPVRRVVLAPMVGGRHSTTSEKAKLSDSSLERMGFTKYVKGEKGYEKTAGSGPSLLTPD